MKLFESDNIREADKYTILHEPIASINLMERAANQLTLWISKRIEKEVPISIFAGPGNNGGDGWALARLLVKKGYANISFYLLNIGKPISPDSEINKKRLLKESQILVKNIESVKDFPKLNKNELVIDALFGTGLTHYLEGLAANLIGHINNSPKKSIFSIDIPSGLFVEDNTENIEKSIIRADYTLSFEFPKLSFFFPENEKFTGVWEVLPIGIHPDFIESTATPYHYITEDDVVERLKIRRKYSHKGLYGHALMIAGSYGMMGAAVLATRSAARAGAGLVTAHVPRLGSDIIQIAVPESLLSIDKSDTLFTSLPDLKKFTAIGVGPGINQKEETKIGLINLLQNCKVPMVIDADGLNILASIENWEELLPANCILTPHPKEYERLFGITKNSFERLKQQKEFSLRTQCTVLLKGAHSCITTADGEVWFNTSGNPGMATGGSGDVLTGLILGLAAQNYSISEAAIIAVYLHGTAGTLAAQKHGQHGMIATDIIEQIGPAYCLFEKKKSMIWQ